MTLPEINRIPSPSRDVSVCALSLAITLALSACGGGSPSPESTESGGVVAELAPEAMVMTGTVVVEERGGKTVFDGWFAQTPVDEMELASAPKTITDDTCLFESHSPESDQLADHLDAELEYIQSSPQLGAANELLSIGDSLRLESRVGEFDSLIKQVSGDTVVYAQEDRWQVDQIPDDTVLVFDNLTAFSNLDSVSIRPLMPLVWITPATGVMSNAASALQWEASFDEQVQISLRLSAIDFRDSENPVAVSVTCDVVDDGLFTLPAEFQQLLPNDESNIAVYAVRERVETFVGNATSLTVKQLSYPSPITP